MISVNRQALEIVEQMVARAEELSISVTHLPCGTRVFDLGLEASGGWQAGKYAAEISLGGLGQVDFVPATYGTDGSASEPELWLPGVRVVVDQPVIACIASQYAGWGIRKGDYFAIGSGPARAMAAVEPVFQQLEYRDSGDVAVLILEGRQKPTEEIAQYIARKCRIDPAGLTLLAAPAASLAGSFQISARVVATGMHQMLYQGFDFKQVLHGYGSAPIPPVVASEELASALCNDCVLSGGRVHYTVKATDDQIEAFLQRIPSVSSPDYGTPFYQLYQRYGNFYDVDKLIFCPSTISINNIASGRTFRAGQPHPGVLEASLLGKRVG